MQRAVLVTDLGFGDAGKGLVTDHLVRRLGARLVVRSHGGAQAGHNVVTPDGRHHTFAQLGAGTFVPGVRTFLGRHMVVHPTALLTEAAHLASVGVGDALSRLHISEQALFISPFQQAMNRLRELCRGDARHGSCGVGVGEAVKDSLQFPNEALRMGLFRSPIKLRMALARQQERKREEMKRELPFLPRYPSVERERWVLEDPSIPARFIEAIQPLRNVPIVADSWFREALSTEETVIFEGAQGVLLDEDVGFHPYTTWSRCTFARGLTMLREASFQGEIERIGVLRTYAVRHGHGPFPTEDRSLDKLLPEPHNEDGPWQGRVRRGWPDVALSRYALEACGGADSLAITHLDALPRVAAWQVCTKYTNPDDAGNPLVLTPPATPDLERQAAVTERLAKATPVYEAVEWSGDGGAERATRYFGEALGVPVRLAAYGPSSDRVTYGRGEP
ncbi:MAG: adenylosuccinate synthetase [Polyangiaceae bacterium]